LQSDPDLFTKDRKHRETDDERTVIFNRVTDVLKGLNPETCPIFKALAANAEDVEIGFPCA